MHIIPVIDLYQGKVVHAVRGQRADYQPLKSGLYNSSDPHVAVQAFLNLYPFNTLYIADLDAIQGNAGNQDIIEKLQQDFPQLVLWVDSGLSRKEQLCTGNQPSIIHVIGSETGITVNMLADLTGNIPDLVLSLDFKAGKFCGDTEILKHPEFWPHRIIVMNLARVGTVEGPDMELLQFIKSVSGKNNTYMAGGIRNIDDIHLLYEHGVSGVLLATALHNGSITKEDLITV